MTLLNELNKYIKKSVLQFNLKNQENSAKKYWESVDKQIGCIKY